MELLKLNTWVELKRQYWEKRKLIFSQYLGFTMLLPHVFVCWARAVTSNTVCEYIYIPHWTLFSFLSDVVVRAAAAFDGAGGAVCDVVMP